MATWDDVSRLALALPETTEGSDTNGRKWEVRRTYFAYERPLRGSDVDDFGGPLPDGPILGVRVADIADKRGLIGSDPEVFFTMPRYADYPAVLVLLDAIPLDLLDEVLTEAWLCRAPKRLAARFLAYRGISG